MEAPKRLYVSLGALASPNHLASSFEPSHSHHSPSPTTNSFAYYTMQTVYKFPPYTFLDEFTPLESADASSSSNHPTQPPCKRLKQAVDFDEVDPEDSAQSWAYLFVRPMSLFLRYGR